MSGFSIPQDAAVSAAPKQISSRLLGMKFMQRAAATATQTGSSTPKTPSDERRPKRRRTDDFSTTVDNLHSPATPASSIAPTSEVNGLSIRRGINNFDAPGVETEWTLDVRLPVANGTTNNVDHDYESESEDESSGEDEIWSSAAPRGRQTYGSFNKKKQKSTKTSAGTDTTPSSTAKSTRKRGIPEDEEELSSLPSNSDLGDESSEGEAHESPKSKQTGKFNLKSEKDLKAMDDFDFQRAGFEHGFGRQRPGLSGGGGGGRSYGSSNHGRGKPKKKVRKTM